MAFLTISLYSEILQMDTCVNVILPENRKKGVETSVAEKRYPVLYLLHGHGDDHTAWSRKSIIETIVRDYDIITVMPTTYRGFYVDNKEGLNYFKYLSEELPIKMANFFHVSLADKDSYVIGNSMGGYGAMRLSLAYPKRFAGAASLSGALMPYGDPKDSINFMSDGMNDDFVENQQRALGQKKDFIGSENDLCQLVRRLDGEIAPKLYICCGNHDALTYNQYKLFQKNIQEQDIHLPIKWSESTGEHNWDYWNPRLKEIFDYFNLDKKK